MAAALCGTLIVVGALLLVGTGDHSGPSVMLIEGRACGQALEGTGFYADEVVVTNAHVVSGATELEVTDQFGSEWEAEVVALDPESDLAALRLNGSVAAWHPAGFADADSGDRGSVGSGQFEVRRRIRAHINDIEGEPVVRPSLEIEALILPGDSGAPLVDDAGLVVGVVYATSRGKQLTAYAVRSPEVEEFLARVGTDSVVTGTC